MRLSRPSVIALVLLTPLLAALGFFIVVPAFQLLWISLTNLTPGRPAEFIGLDNYGYVLSDPAFIAALLRNIAFVLVVVVLEVGVGFAIALVLQLRFPLRSLWFAIILAPFAVSPIVAVVMWKYMLDPTFGIVNYAIASLGLPTVPWMTDAATSMAVIIIVAVWKEFAFTTIVLFAALTSIPKELYEAAHVDGANPWQNLIHIKIPLIAPAIAIVLLFRIIFTLREFGIPWTLTGGGPGTATEILSIYLYKQAFRYSDFGAGAAIGWIMLAVTVLLSSFLIRRTYRGMFPEDR
ncbi:carbohydrate ABC transporter permease [Devosia insulae]|uniref:carbohydrate ABC transporter permease n=1 Tax=Devosia insulae TaxID=408174 RepID=UPI00159F2ADC|nr:sugar ABC transporter permease [Devosia insulae]